MGLFDRGVQMLLTTVGAFAAFSLMTIAVGTDYWLYSRGVCKTKTVSENETSKKNEEVMTHSGLWRTCCLEGIWFWTSTPPHPFLSHHPTFLPPPPNKSLHIPPFSHFIPFAVDWEWWAQLLRAQRQEDRQNIHCSVPFSLFLSHPPPSHLLQKFTSSLQLE